MNNPFRKPLLAIAAAVAAVAMVSPATAQDYPSQPIEMIVSYAAGGPTDTLARLTADGLSQILDQSVVVVNRPGGNTVIGTTEVGRADPDGYTLLFADDSFARNRALYGDDLPYNPLEDFQPIAMVAGAPSVLVVNPSVDASTVQDIVELSQESPLNFATAGVGNTTHLPMEALKIATGADISRVSYAGGAPALNAVVSGEVPMMMISVGTARGQIEAGRVDPIAILGTERSPVLPDVPTFGEAGIDAEALELGTTWGVVAPAGTPEEVVQTLNDAINQLVESEDFQERLAPLGNEAIGGSVEDYAANLSQQVEIWSPVVETADIQIQ